MRSSLPLLIPPLPSLTTHPPPFSHLPFFTSSLSQPQPPLCTVQYSICRPDLYGYPFIFCKYCIYFFIKFCDYFSCSYIRPYPLLPSTASAPSLSYYIQPQPQHPASATTSSLSHSIQPQSLLSTAAFTSSPVPASASAPRLNFYNPIHPLHSASASASILSLYIQPHIYMMLKSCFFSTNFLK